MQSPCSCFITFETEEGMQRACYYNDAIKDSIGNFEFLKRKASGKKGFLQKYFEPENSDNIVPYYFRNFLGHKCEMDGAPEPSDIIWENREVTNEFRRKRTRTVWFFISILMLISASCIYFFTYYSISLKLRYPITDCKDNHKRFEGKDKLYEEKAFYEFLVNEHLKKRDKPTTYKNTMQCFCRKHRDDDIFTIFGYTYKEKTLGALLENKMYSYTYNDKKYEMKFCKMYFRDMLLGEYMGKAVSYIIIFANWIMKTYTIQLITSIRHDTYSGRLSNTMIAVFIAQFFNTGILLLLMNANMTEHSPYFITRWIKSGKFSDYSPLWYSEIGGKIVKAMKLNAYMPFLSLLATHREPKKARKADQKDVKVHKETTPGGIDYRTKKTSLAGYKQLYSGGDYFLDFKYSNVLNIVFVTMLYGLGLPILFPIAVGNFINQYICERIMVAYYMK